MELLRLESVSYTVSGETVLQDVSLSVSGTDFLSIIGPNGGGKSTLLQLIVGIKKPTSGSIRLMGQAPKVGRSEIGYLPQYSEFDRVFPISVEETVAWGVCLGTVGCLLVATLVLGKINVGKVGGADARPAVMEEHKAV